MTLCNGGLMALAGAHALSLLSEVKPQNAQNEFYLTDVVALARARGLPTAFVTVDEAEIMGVNDRVQLARAEAGIQARLREAAMRAGATLVDPASVTLAFDTRLGRDVVVEPHVVFAPGVDVAEGARIRAFSHLEGVSVGARAIVGPFARLRPGSVLGADVHVGNFVEVKASTLEAGVKANHLSYIGDASVGARSNVGAGTITCNYDGFLKSRTTIGADVFVGSHSSLIAPVTVGEGAYIGTGSVVTDDVSPHALVLARARQVEKPGWAKAFRAGRSTAKIASARRNPERLPMCGIVGILGREPVADRLVEALKRLEYRGYDSAGVATLEDGHLVRRRAKGKLKNLEAVLRAEPLGGTIGIGHTRWATHGRPTENNAHPHATAKVAVVHNGIIENFRELREELRGKGHVFATETDTEVVAHLVTDALDGGLTPAEAVAASLPRLRGAFALAFLFDGETNLLIGARQGAPLAVGYGQGDNAGTMYLGSDALALAPFTDTLTYLEEGDWVVLTHDKAVFFDASHLAVERRRLKTMASAFLVDKGNYRHFMAKEIHEQPEVVARTLAHYLDMSAGRVALPFALPVDPQTLDKLTITACGTAYMAGLTAKYWFEKFARLPVTIEVSSEFRYGEVPMAPQG